jgi:hypothetical protein
VTVADLKGLLKKAGREYEARKAAAERQVVRWGHWSGPAYDLKPLYFERNQRGGAVKRGKPVPKATARTCSYGFDAKNRVVIDRQPKSRDEPAYDEFFTYGKGCIESASYRREAPHALAYVTRQEHRGGKPVTTDVLDADGKTSFSERYDYAKGRISEINVVSIAGKDKKEVRYDVVYERDGRLRAVRRYYYSTLAFPIYWNPELGETLESLTGAMRRKLLDAILNALRKARIKESAYCVAIVYDSAADELPPRLAVGLESERQALISRKGKTAKEVIWIPAGFGGYKPGKIALSGPDLEYDSERLLQMILMKEALWIPRRMLNEIAQELNGRSWRGLMPVTDDFIVYAFDSDGGDFAKNIKEGVPEAKRKLLRSRRLL